MSLTIGTGPFSRSSAGVFNFPIHAPRGQVLLLDASPRRVRGLVGDEVVVDSRAVRLLHGTGHLPVRYFPGEAVGLALLEPSETSTHCPFKGDARYLHVRVGDRLIRDAVWSYPGPLEG